MVSEGGADTTGELQPGPEAFSSNGFALFGTLRVPAGFASSDVPRLEGRDENSDGEEGEQVHQNCSFSVEPTSALVLESPPEITSDTTSK